MAKGYWISAYREINDPTKLAAYAELAAPAVKANGGNFLVREEQSQPKKLVWPNAQWLSSSPVMMSHWKHTKAMPIRQH